MSVQAVVDGVKGIKEKIVFNAIAGALGSVVVTLISKKTGLLASAHCVNPLVGGALFASTFVISRISSIIFDFHWSIHMGTGLVGAYGAAKLLNSITYIGAGVNIGASIGASIAIIISSLALLALIPSNDEG